MQVFGFFLQNLIFDAVQIRSLNDRLEILTNLTIFVHEVQPDLFSEHVATDVCFALVDEEGFLVVRAVIATNNNLVCKSENEFL